MLACLLCFEEQLHLEPLMFFLNALLRHQGSENVQFLLEECASVLIVLLQEQNLQPLIPIARNKTEDSNHCLGVNDFLICHSLT